MYCNPTLVWNRNHEKVLARYPLVVYNRNIPYGGIKAYEKREGWRAYE